MRLAGLAWQRWWSCLNDNSQSNKIFQKEVAPFLVRNRVIRREAIRDRGVGKWEVKTRCHLTSTLTFPSVHQLNIIVRSDTVAQFDQSHGMVQRGRKRGSEVRAAQSVLAGCRSFQPHREVNREIGRIASYAHTSPYIQLRYSFLAVTTFLSLTTIGQVHLGPFWIKARILSGSLGTSSINDATLRSVCRFWLRLETNGQC